MIFSRESYFMISAMFVACLRMTEQFPLFIYNWFILWKLSKSEYVSGKWIFKISWLLLMSTHHKNEFNYAFNFSSFICERDSWITFQLVNIQVMGRGWWKSTSRPVFSSETWSHPGEQETSEWNSGNGQSLLQWRGRQLLQQQLYQKKVSGIYNLIKLCKLSLVFIRPDKWEWLHVQTEYVSVPPAWSPWSSIMNSSSSGSFPIPQ